MADDVEAQSAGNPNWCKDAVQGWNELDYVPSRVLFSGGPVNGKVVTVAFNHTAKNGTPEFQFLTGFTPSANVVMATQPALSAPPGSSVWTYTFTVNLLDGNPAQVTFLARLSAGAHLNPAGLLAFSSQALEVAQPHAAAGGPDLDLARIGAPALAPGTTVTFTLGYTNNEAFAGATGVQLTELLPRQFSYVPGSASGDAVLVGNTLTWDLGNLAAGASGSVNYTVVINTNASPGQTFNDTAMIFSAEDNANAADNVLHTTLTVEENCQPPTIVSSPSCATSCGGSACFNVAATGSAPLNFQWRKNGSPIPGATQSSYSIATPCSADAATYDVIVTNGCGSATSSTAVLGIGQPIASWRALGDGTFQLAVTSLANRQYAVQYSTDMVHWTNAQTGFVGNGGTIPWIDSSAPNAAQRFYRVVLLP